MIGNCICCGADSVRVDGPGWVCNDCRNVLDKIDNLPPGDRYFDVQKCFTESIAGDEVQHYGSNKTQSHVRLEKLPETRNREDVKQKPERNESWKWEGLNPNGSLPDSWWEGGRI